MADFSEIREKIATLSELLNVSMTEAELNNCIPALNDSATAENMLAVFESYLEIGASYEKDVKTVLGRIGGISVAAVLFDGGEEGVELTAGKFAKIKDFAELACCRQLPFVVFANVRGIEPTMAVNDSRVMKEAAEYLDRLDTVDTAKIAVVYRKAIGLGYSLFAAKSAGFDYTCAFATARIALFDSVQGAVVELGNGKESSPDLEARYADENSDPINAAKDGYIDAVIEPQFVRQYLIASLQMLAK